MNKNLILVQNGFPGSNTSGTEVDTLDIKNFFKYEKSVSASKYARRYVSAGAGATTSYLTPYSGSVSFDTRNKEQLRKTALPVHWYEDYTGELGYKDNFKHYSTSFLLFAVRMKKGFLGTNVTITSRISQDASVKLRFFNIGDTVDSFSALKELDAIYGSYSWDVYAHRMLSDSIVIPSVNQYNHCFLAALFSDSVYELESGTSLLNNEPLLNISWTETEFTEAQ